MLLSEVLNKFYVLPLGQSEIVDYQLITADQTGNVSEPCWLISWTDSDTLDKYEQEFHDQEIQFGELSQTHPGEFFVNDRDGEACGFLALDGVRFEPERLLINLEGGLVQAVLSEHTAHDVLVVDYDTEGADDDEITEIPQDGGGVAEACAHTVTTLVDPVFVKNAFAAE
jgi:hypothetical protein